MSIIKVYISFYSKIVVDKIWHALFLIIRENESKKVDIFSSNFKPYTSMTHFYL